MLTRLDIQFSVYKNGDHRGMNGPVWLLWWISNFKEEMRNVYDESQMDGNADERIYKIYYKFRMLDT